MWVQERLLRSGVGSALVLAAKNKNARILLPSVIEQEVREVTRRLCREARDKIETNMQTIRAIVGRSASIQFPETSEVETAIDSRFAEFGPLIERLLPPHQLWEAALDRVIRKLPPNQGKEEQFRDSLIWQVVSDYAAREEVVLISNDKAFYDANKGDQLHSELAEELHGKALDGRVAVYRSIDTYLRAAGEALLSFNRAALVAAVDVVCRKLAEDGPADLGYAPAALIDPLIRVFATERPGVLAVMFDMRYAADDVPLLSGDVLPRAVISIKGSCAVSTDTWTLENVQWESVLIVDEKGQRLPARGIVYARAHSSLGMQYESYEVRYELSPPAA